MNSFSVKTNSYGVLAMIAALNSWLDVKTSLHKDTANSIKEAVERSDLDEVTTLCTRFNSESSNLKLVENFRDSLADLDLATFMFPSDTKGIEVKHPVVKEALTTGLEVFLDMDGDSLLSSCKLIGDNHLRTSFEKLLSASHILGQLSVMRSTLEREYML